MKTLRWLLLGEAVVMGVVAAIFLLIGPPAALAVALWLLAVAPLAALVATGYLAYLYLRAPRDGDDWLYPFLVVGAAHVTTALLIVGVLAVRNRLGHEPLDPTITGLLLCLAFLFAAWVPIGKAVLIRANRSRPTANGKGH